MRLPTLSVVMTIHDRKPAVLKEVFDSLEAQPWDQLVVVFDKPTRWVRESAKALIKDMVYGDGEITQIDIDREPSWLCPSAAWNRGFKEVTSELTYCISSEVIQQEGNIARAKEIQSGLPTVVFGRCVDDGPAPVVTGPNPHLLCGVSQPRPLGFIMSVPTWALRTIHGYDEGFMDGYGWEDDDFAFRLWRLGLPFVFDDRVNGTHQHHDRQFLKEREKIEKNRRYIIDKWGEEHPWNSAEKQVVKVCDSQLVMFPDGSPELESAWKVRIDRANSPTGNFQQE